MELQPIVPFEPVQEKVIPEGSEWVHQIKWDGVRVLTYCDGKEVRLYNRKKNERTLIFPELADASAYKADSFIIDGEVIALDTDGKPSFHEVMKRDGIRNSERARALVTAVPIFYMIFDLLYCNGEWINDHPFIERAHRLKQLVQGNDKIQVVPFFGDGKALFESAKKQKLEGIVSKKVDSPYLINGKNGNWKKIKKIEDLIAVIGGVTYRADRVNALLLGLYNQHGELVYIGHAGTGKLTDEDWGAVTQIADSLKSEERPFLNKPERVKTAQWLKPVLTVKVAFSEWTEGHVLRQPSIQAFVHLDPKQCRIEAVKS